MPRPPPCSCPICHSWLGRVHRWRGAHLPLGNQRCSRWALVRRACRSAHWHWSYMGTRRLRCTACTPNCDACILRSGALHRDGRPSASNSRCKPRLCLHVCLSPRYRGRGSSGLGDPSGSGLGKFASSNRVRLTYRGHSFCVGPHALCSRSSARARRTIGRVTSPKSPSEGYGTGSMRQSPHGS